MSFTKGKELELQNSSVMRTKRMGIKQSFNFLLICAD